ncbi:MAG: hypothetical protein [Bacteriophage sp.]|nr:MAG: hypothetical protein [Bacteriophage sp.]
MSNPEILTYIPFAVNGEKNTIQVYRQANQDQEDATFSEGWPKITMIPLSSGGIPPKGLDVNGVLYQLSLDTVHRQSGKQMQYDATYASNIKGYSKGAMLQSSDLTRLYLNTVDGNLTDPDSSSASGWNVYAQTPTATSTTTGTVKIADNLTSIAKDTALTANQGRVLASMMASESSQQSIGDNIIKWGQGVTDNSGKLVVTLDSPFSNNILSVTATNVSSGAPGAFAGVGNFSKNGFTIYSAISSGVSSGAGYTYNWLAIGN